MSKDPNQPSEEITKKLADINDTDIMDAAIRFVAELGKQVSARECRVVPVMPPQQKTEIGDATSVRLSISKWDVHITSRPLPIGFYVTVEYVVGGLEVVDFNPK